MNILKKLGPVFASKLVQKQKDRNTERQKDRKTERQKDRETERQKDRETEKQRNRKTEKHKDRKTIIYQFVLLIEYFRLNYIVNSNKVSPLEGIKKCYLL
jgi:hypothetical protein